MDEPNINEKYKLIALHYVGDCCGNAEKAMIAAGYSKAYARGAASRVIAKDSIQRYIKYLNSLVKDEHIASIEEIQQFWTSVFHNNTYKTADRLKASELLAKSKGAFNTDDWD